MSLTKPIPKEVRERISKDPFFKTCARTDDPNNHSGRLTVDHAIYYAGKRLNDYWCLVSVCWHHNLGAGLKKNVNQAIAYSRATDEDLQKYPKLSIPHARAIQKLFAPL